MKLRKLFASALAALMMFSQAAPVLAAETVKVGGNFELSGEAVEYGTPMRDGMELAIKQANEKGGVLDRQIEAVVQDNKTDKTEAAALATLLSDEGVVGVVGPATTGDTQATFPVMNEEEVPAVLPAATGDGLTLDEAGKVMDYIFRVCFEDSYQGVAAAHFVHDNLQMKKIALVTDATLDYSVGVAKAFKEEFEKLGGEIVAEESFNTGDRDFMAILTNLDGKDFEALYVPGYYPETGPFIRQARELGMNQPIIGSDGYHNDALVELAEASNATDIYFTTHFEVESEEEKVKSFIEAFKAEHNKTPDTFAALAYDATNLLLDAVQRANSTDPKEVAKALAATEKFEGVTGTFDINDQHNPDKPALMLHLVDGVVDSVVEVSAN